MAAKRALQSVTIVTALLLAAGCSGDPAAAPTASPAPVAPSATGGATTAPEPVPTTSAAPATPLTGTVALDPLTGRATSLTLDQRPLDALSALGITVDAVAPARAGTAPGGGTRLEFPVTGGALIADAEGSPRLTGSVQHSGGLQVSALGRSVTVDQLVLDAERGALTGVVAGRRLPLLPLDLADASLQREGEAVVVTDEAVTLHPDAAGELAGQLRLPALPPLELGQLRLDLIGQ